MRGLPGLLFVFLAAGSAMADAAKPKLGPNATPIFQSTEYLRSAAAPDYWALSPFYVPQRTSSDCSAAAAVIAMNALRGLPARADQEILTEDIFLKRVGDRKWRREVVENGPGVKFAEFAGYLRESARAAGLADATVSATQIREVGPSELDGLRKLLKDNETSAKDIMLVYFNQGVVTGDWNGPHISPIGAYDEARDRVLIMDVDRQWYVPYWTSTETLLAALAKPAPKDQGVLAGETGGYYLVTRP